MKDKLNNIIGQKFNRYLVLERAENSKKGASRWVCLCDCGNKRIVNGSHLKKGRCKSCGCYSKEKVVERSTKHGNASLNNRSPTYLSWQSMKQRCQYEKSISYKYYGARQIKVCDEWLNSFSKFLEDMGERPLGTSLGRIDNNDNYNKENCRWETPKEQCKNKINILRIIINGENLTTKEAWEKYPSNTCYETFRKKIKKICQHDEEF